jgi:hypothetical protein
MFPRIRLYTGCIGLAVSIAAAIAGALLAATPARGNVLLNPGFETPDATAGDQYAVVGTSSWNGFNGAYITQGTAETGLQSFKSFGNPGGAFQDFPASPGQVWKGTVDSENLASDALVGQQGTFINLEWHDIGGGQISFVSTPIANSLSTTNVWLPGSVMDTAPAGTAFVRLVLLCGPYTGIGTGSGGAGFFDNATLDLIPEPASLSLIALAGLLPLRRRR